VLNEYQYFNQRQSGDRQKGLFKAKSFIASNFHQTVEYGKKLTAYRIHAKGANYVRFSVWFLNPSGS
jgi:hypothetical protein